MLFLNTAGKLVRVSESSFKLEKDLQTLAETNLREIFGLEFVTTEFVIHDLRIDTLGFDTENNSFVVIEYKRDKNSSVVDQGYAYLSAVLNNKADFVLEYNQKFGKNLKKDDVDWSQVKVIFVAPQFTPYQEKAISFKDLPIELWTVTKFENHLIGFNQLKAPSTSESINTISKSQVVKKVSGEIKVYTEEDHLKLAPEAIKELYYALKENILKMGNEIEIAPKKLYIGFKRNTNFTDIVIQKTGLKVFINLKKGQVIDPLKKTRDVSNTGHWGNGDYEITVSNQVEMIYAIGIILQSYDKN